MVPQRFQITLRIGPGLEANSKKWLSARTITSTVATLLLEWGYEQLKAAETTERLRRCGIAFAKKQALPIA
jgi:hypothetical protein